MKRIFRYEIQEKDAGKTIETFLLEHEYTPTCIKSLKKAESLITVNGKWEFVNKLLQENDILETVFLDDGSSENIPAVEMPLDIIYEDEEKRGICIWRDAHNEYDIIDFLMYPHWIFLYFYAKSTIKTLKAYGHLDVKVFPENTLIISPVFTAKEHQGKGIATKLIKEGIRDLVPQGYKLGLEAQNPENVKFYEKLGFRTIKYVYFKSEKIHNYYIMYDPDGTLFEENK